MANNDLAGALAALAGAAGGGGGGSQAAPSAGPAGGSMPPELNLFAQLAAVSHLLQQAQGGGGAGTLPPAGDASGLGQGLGGSGPAGPAPLATPSGRAPLPQGAALNASGYPPSGPTRSGESGQGGRTTSSAYASRHQAAEQRRRNRINER